VKASAIVAVIVMAGCGRLDEQRLRDSFAQQMAANRFVKGFEPRGAESNLPFELISNGLSQDGWALWDEAAGRWSWE
jgi:hypothetical protein